MRTSALFLLVALTSFSLRAQTPTCIGTRIYSGAFRASVLDVAVDGDDLWAATSYGVTLYDALADPPRPLTSVALPGATTRIRAAGGLAFAGSGNRLYVLRAEADRIVIVTSVDVGGRINDLLLTGDYMYVATSTGIAQIDLIVPTAPSVGPRLSTSSGLALSLGRFESTLYAADGDSSIEMYSIQIPSFPQRTGTFTGLPQSTSVRVAGLNVLVSDGQQTQLFTVGNPPVRVGNPILVPSTALYSYEGSVAFVAGSGRTLRAIDLSSTPAVVFNEDLPISEGSVNRIEGITGRADRIYVAGGDAGLVTFDVSAFHAPWPMRSIAVGEFTSIARTTNGFVASAAEGGLTFFSVATGSDVPLAGSSWETSKTWTIHDVQGATLVATSGRTLTVFNVSFGNGSVTSTATFPETLTGAVFVGTRIYALTETETTRSLWEAEMSQSTTIPSKVNAGVASPAKIARHGSAVAIAEFTDAGKTVIHYWAEGNPLLPAERVEVDGAATSGLTLSAAGRAAVATFKGISIIQFPAKTISLIPGVPPGRDIEFDGEQLLFATESSVRQYDAVTATQVAEWGLPATATALQVGPSIGGLFYALTEEGVVSIRPGSTANVPQALAEPQSQNRYYTQLAAGGGHLLLADRSRVQWFLTRADGRPSPAGSFNLPFTPVAIAVDQSFSYALSVSGRLSVVGFDGVERRTITFNEGNDATFSQLKLVGGALHAGLLRGCSSGSCEKKTIVVDPATLAQTATYSGAILDAVVAGTTAWVITDSPTELRRLNIADALHPTVSAAVVLTSPNPTQQPVSIGRSAQFGTIYVLGARLFAFNENTLAATGTMLDAFAEDPTRLVTYLDQDVSVRDSCITIAGRTFSPQVGTLNGPATLGLTSALDVPAAGKRVVVDGGVTYILTDYSLEVYSLQPDRERKRPLRR